MRNLQEMNKYLKPGILAKTNITDIKVILITSPKYIELDHSIERLKNVVILNDWFDNIESKLNRFPTTEYLCTNAINFIVADVLNDGLAFDKVQDAFKHSTLTIYIIAERDWSDLTNKVLVTDFFFTMRNDSYRYFLITTNLGMENEKKRLIELERLVTINDRIICCYHNSTNAVFHELSCGDSISLRKIEKLNVQYQPINKAI